MNQPCVARKGGAALHTFLRTSRLTGRLKFNKANELSVAVKARAAADEAKEASEVSLELVILKG